MGHILKNQNLEIQIDFPLENYHFPRFDWTGKIASAKFKNIQITGLEDLNCENENLLGKGFYNEFGIESPLGFDETEIGGWFHKIGVGLLQKEGEHYEFNKNYKIKPAEFHTSINKTSVRIHCISASINGFSYELQKAFELHETSFSIKYCLKNTGKKLIQTEEYVHNFIAVNNDLIGKSYDLNFPMDLKPGLVGETVNPESAICIEGKEIKLNTQPKKQFFFSNLTGGEDVQATWELHHLKTKIGIRESANFITNKVNFWGWTHVISPELFFNIEIMPGQSTAWTRTFEVFNL